MRPILCLLLLSVIALAQEERARPTAPSVTWQTSVNAALALSKETGRPVLWVIMKDREIACRRMLTRVYTAPEVIARSSAFVLLPSNLSDHEMVKINRDGAEVESCPQFLGCTCAHHRTIELEMRKRFIQTEEVVAPQHIFTDAEGTVLVRKEYELDARGLLALMDEAIAKSKGESPPEPAASDSAGLPTPAPDETVDVAEIQRLLGVLIGTPTDGKTELTQEFIKSTGERGAEGLVDALETGKFRTPKDREVVVRALGYEQYLTAAKPFTTLLDHKDAHLRNCVVVTLEEMGDAVAAKPLLARYAKERSPEVRKDILRALGPTGKDNEEARALLLDSVKGGPEILRTAAAVALGDHVSGSKDVRDALAKAYARAGRGNLKLGVLYAYWIGNDPECAAELGRIKETERNNELVQLAEVIQAGLQDRDPDVGSGGGRGGRGGRGGDFGGNFGAFRALGALRQLFADDKIARHPNGRLRRLLGGFGGGR